jgi:hypothetical protein
MPYPFDQPRFESEPVPEDYRPIALDTDILGKCVGLWVGAAGTVAAQMIDGTARTLPGVPAGTFLRGRFKQVLTAGTTVAAPGTNILAAVMIG